LLIFIFLIAYSDTYAISKTFLATSGNWSIAANWLPAGVPTAGDDITIPVGKTAIVTGNLSNPAIRSLIVIGFLDLRDNGKLGVDVFLFSQSPGHIFADSNNDQLRIGTTTYVSTNINTITGSTGTPPTGLPVKLKIFDFQIQNAEILLHWITSSEINFRDFYIQKSTDSKTFETIGTIIPNVTSLYSFEDLYPKNGLQYYRLQMNDIDGSVNYSKIIAAKYAYELQNAAFPNPSSDGSFYYNSPLKNLTFEVFTHQGQKIPLEVFQENGQYKIKILGDLHQKILFLNIKSESNTEVQKLIMN
jgi:hypothetical protein